MIRGNTNVFIDYPLLKNVLYPHKGPRTTLEPQTPPSKAGAATSENVTELLFENFFFFLI